MLLSCSEDAVVAMLSLASLEMSTVELLSALASKVDVVASEETEEDDNVWDSPEDVAVLVTGPATELPSDIPSVPVTVLVLEDSIEDSIEDALELEAWLISKTFDEVLLTATEAESAESVLVLVLVDTVDSIGIDNVALVDVEVDTD